MAYAKTDLFDPRLNATAVLFKALAHPARLAILKYLAETRVCITGDISDELPLSRTTVNQHLKELKNAGLIQGTVDGVRVNYCLNPDRIKELGEVANCFFKEIEVEGGYQCG
jgi:ArsR family transcriptional regulator, arsenate/arsenite/antimonite-responsive transcriptional repressor